jgi:hypothetical protein
MSTFFLVYIFFRMKMQVSFQRNFPEVKWKNFLKYFNILTIILEIQLCVYTRNSNNEKDNPTSSPFRMFHFDRKDFNLFFIFRRKRRVWPSSASLLDQSDTYYSIKFFFISILEFFIYRYFYMQISFLNDSFRL